MLSMSIVHGQCDVLYSELIDYRFLIVYKVYKQSETSVEEKRLPFIAININFINCLLLITPI